MQHRSVITVNENMLKYFFERYNSLKSEYMNRSPRGKWLFVMHLGTMFQKIIGISIMDPNFKVWWFTYTSGVALLDVVLSSIYTIWYYSDNPFKGFLFLSMLGIVVPV